MPYIWESSPRQCEWYKCGKTFTPMRSDAKFCSTKCRVAHHRSGKELEARLLRVSRDCNTLFDEYHKFSLTEEAVRRLRRMANTLSVLADETEGKRQAREFEFTQDVHY